MCHSENIIGSSLSPAGQKDRKGKLHIFDVMFELTESKVYFFKYTMELLWSLIFRKRTIKVKSKMIKLNLEKDKR